MVNKNKIQKVNPIKISTVFKTYILDEQIELDGLSEFKTKDKIKFLLFKFHDYFDGLIGIDIMKELEAKLDLKDSMLYTKNAQIPLIYKPNLSSEKHTIPGQNKILATLPVDICNGSFLLLKTKITKDTYIAEGIYEAKNYKSIMELVNLSDNDCIVRIQQPIKVQPYDTTKYFEINNYNISYINPTQQTKIEHLIRTKHLNSEESSQIIKLCKHYKNIFYQEGQTLSFTNQIKHYINTVDDIPIYTRSYRYPEIHKEEVRTQISKMLEQGIVRHSYSPWSSPIWIVPKKKDASGAQKWRLVVDYRKLNEKTIDDRYPLPNINEILDRLGRSMYFTTMDLASGFNQIEVNDTDISKTAFSVDNGHYEYVRMPFGLKNAPSTFQRVMDNVLREFQGKFCFVYMDDIIVFSTSLQEHIEHISKIFQVLNDTNLKVNLDKTEFLRKEIAFLGHVVTTEGVKPNPDKIRAVKEFPIPTTKKQIKSFLGLLGYYRKFIRDFAKLTKPLTQCLRKDADLELTPKYIECFETCKNILCNDPVLQYPDFSKNFNLTTDASNIALGAVLSQGKLGSDKPVCYASRTLSKSEQSYSTIEKELLAIVWATKYFRPYLFGRKFKIITDHKPLTYLFSMKDPNSMLVRWRLKLQEFDYEVVYKKGKENTNADALSRVQINNIEAHNDDQNDPLKPQHPINLQLRQYIITKDNDINEMDIKTKILFQTKIRHTIKIRTEYMVDDINDLLINFVHKNKLNSIYTTDEIYEIIQNQIHTVPRLSTLKTFRCTNILQDVINKIEQTNLIRDYHTTSNHRGITETLNHLRRSHYFPAMRKAISDIINSCEICQKFKYDRGKQQIKFLITETPHKPLQILHVDVYAIKNELILTIIDKFSRFAGAYLLQSRNTLNIIQALEQFFSNHGIPQKIISDNGAEFLSVLFKDFLKLYSISHHMTTPKNSTGNSTVERFHSTLTELTSIIYSQNKTMPFLQILSKALITYNNSIHTSTKVTPFELISGHFYNSKPFPMSGDSNSKQDYINDHRQTYDQITKLIQEKEQIRKRKLIEKCNETRKDPRTFQEDQTIYERDNRRDKLAPKFQPHRVTENKDVTILSNNRKVHKQKIKSNRKISGAPTSQTPNN